MLLRELRMSAVATGSGVQELDTALALVSESCSADSLAQAHVALNVCLALALSYLYNTNENVTKVKQ